MRARRLWRRLYGAPALLLVVGIVPRPTVLAAQGVRLAATTAQPLTLRLTGKIVRVELKGSLTLYKDLTARGERITAADLRAGSHVYATGVLNTRARRLFLTASVAVHYPRILGSGSTS